MVDDIGDSFSVHDMMIPAGKVAKLVRIPNITDESFRISEVCNHLKFVDPTPVIILAGAMTERAGKTLAGVARAASRTDAIIIDSGVGSGIEKFCMRHKTTLIGVAPENEVKYPRINYQGRKDNELTNGHTHFVLIGDNEAEAKEQGRFPNRYFWGDEYKVKIDLARRLQNGRPKKNGPPPARIVLIIVGDNPLCHKEIEYAISAKIPVVILYGSEFASSCANGPKVVVD